MIHFVKIKLWVIPEWHMLTKSFEMLDWVFTQTRQRSLTPTNVNFGEVVSAWGQCWQHGAQTDTFCGPLTFSVPRSLTTAESGTQYIIHQASPAGTTTTRTSTTYKESTRTMVWYLTPIDNEHTPGSTTLFFNTDVGGAK